MYTPGASTRPPRLNITDRDSRSVKTRKGFIQGYNAQAAATSEQIIIAAEIIGNGVDYGLLEPVVDAAVGELAAAVHLSVRHFSRILRAATGLSPAKVVEGLRLEAARILLEQSRQSIGIIATETGFGDQERMRRAFVRAFGQSPQSLRRLARLAGSSSPP